MTTVLHDYRHIWRVAAIERGGVTIKVLAWLTGLAWIVALAFGLAVGIMGVIGVPVEAPGALARVLAAGPAAALLALWVLAYMPGSTLMHAAPSARLLPRQHRRLLQMAYAGWLLPTALLALAGRDWALFPVVGLIVLVIGLIHAGNVAVFALLVPLLGLLLARAVLPPAVVAAFTETASLQGASVLLVVGAWFLLRSQYPATGGEQLGRRVEAQQEVLGGNAARAPRTTMSIGDYPYLLALRRDARLHHPGAMLLHALGPAAHWTVRIATAVVMLLFGLGARAWFARHGGPVGDTFVSAFQPFSWTMLGIVATCTMPVRTRLAALGGEQALLRLTPLTGDPALLNRRLAAALLASGLLHWLLAAAAYMVFVWCVHNDWAPVIEQASLCCLAGQFALAVVFDDVARHPRFGWMSCLWCILPPALEIALVAGVAWRVDASPWPWLAAAGIVGAAFQAWSGWRRMLANPPVFPAGRFD